MNPNIDYTDFEALLNHSVPEETREQLTQQIAEDESLAEDFEFYKDLRTVVEYEGDTQLAALIAQTKNKLDVEDFFKDTQKPVTAKVRQLGTSSRKLYLPIAIAASITLLVGIFGWWNVQQQFNSEALALNNFEADVPTGLRGADNQAQNNLDAGLKAFHNGDLAGAVALFSSTEIQSDSLASTIAYYLGQTYFELKQYDKAVNEFEKVVTSNDIRFKDNAEWYALLANLANGKEVTQALTAITANDNHSYQAQAQELQQKMNSIWVKIAN